jgi:hypothetical protein
VNMCGALLIATQRIDPELVTVKVPLIVPGDVPTQRAQHGPIETLRRRQITSPQVDVIDQTSNVQLLHWRSPSLDELISNISASSLGPARLVPQQRARTDRQRSSSLPAAKSDYHRGP